MDKTTKILISLLGGLAFFIITKEIIISLIICFWLLFAFFSLPHQIFLFFSIPFLIYDLVFKTTNFTYAALMVILGLLLAVLSGFTQSKKLSIIKFLPDTKTISIIIICAFFFFALLFSYRTFQKQQQTQQEVQKEKPAEKVIINLK